MKFNQEEFNKNIALLVTQEIFNHASNVIAGLQSANANGRLKHDLDHSINCAQPDSFYNQFAFWHFKFWSSLQRKKGIENNFLGSELLFRRKKTDLLFFKIDESVYYWIFKTCIPFLRLHTLFKSNGSFITYENLLQSSAEAVKFCNVISIQLIERWQLQEGDYVVFANEALNEWVAKIEKINGAGALLDFNGNYPSFATTRLKLRLASDKERQFGTRIGYGAIPCDEQSVSLAKSLNKAFEKAMPKYLNF